MVQHSNEALAAIPGPGATTNALTNASPLASIITHQQYELQRDC